MSDKANYSESVKVSIAGSRIMQLFNQYDIYQGEACFHLVTKGSEEKVPEGLIPGSGIDFFASIGRVSYHKPTLFMLGKHRLIKLHYSITPPLEKKSESFDKMVKLLQDAGVWVPNLSDEAIEELVKLHNESPHPNYWKVIEELPKSQPEGEHKPYIQPVGWSMFIAVGLLGVVAGILIGLAFG